MRLHKVKIENVLSFIEGSFTCDHHTTALVGANDAGKSNVFRIIDHVLGRSPSLQFPSEMRCHYAEGKTPRVELSFVIEAADRSNILEILGDIHLPQAPFALKATCTEGLLTVTAGLEKKDFRRDGEAILSSLGNSVFVNSRLSPLGSRIILKKVEEGDDFPETRLAQLVGIKDALTKIRRKEFGVQQVLIDAGDRLTRLFREVWKQNSEVAFTFWDHNGDIETRVSDADGPSVPLESRGEGLRWFLAMLVEIKEHARRENSLCNLFLLDEPGAFLHPSGQADLRRILRELSESGANQIIYTTHSPFMLEWAAPHEIRVVKRPLGSSSPSTIVDKPYHGEQRFNFWEPLRSSIGLFVGDLGLLGEKNLLVEGVTDQILLSHIFRTTGEMADWRILPCGNSWAAALIAQACRQAERTVAILVDGDAGGVSYRDVLRRFKIDRVPVHNLLEFYPLVAEGIQVCIEDFLSVSEYLAAVNDAYNDFTWYSPIEELEVAAFDPSEPVTVRLEKTFANRTWPDGELHEFQKTDVAIHLASSRRFIDLRKTAGNFSAIVDRLTRSAELIALGYSQETVDGVAHWWSLLSFGLDRK